MTLKKIELYAFKNNLKTITLNQYEHTVSQLCFELFCDDNNNDNPLDLTVFDEVRFYAQKSDGTIIGKICTIDKTQAKLAVPLQLTTVKGLAKCTVECSRADGNIRFGGFNINVIASQDSDKAIESTDEFTLLETTIAEAKKVISEGVATDEQVSNAVENYFKENPSMDNESEFIPSYWLEHLNSRISDIKALQDSGGKDCFSFVVLADMHWGSNLGKKSPQLAKYIMDKCGIKKCLILGDTQSRGAWSTKELAEAEFDETAKALSVINGKLRTQGNHDGSWGTLNGESYAYNFLQNELYNRIYRNVYAENTNAKTDSTGTAYYVDDDTDKVRYIMLNTHCNAYAENDDGSVMYNNMKVFRFTQSQYDFLCNDALATVSDGYSVIVGAHAPISNMYADLFGGTDGEAKTMRGVLSAYANKTTYSREWAGTANGGAAYTNLADSSSGDWLTGYRINSSKEIVKVENATDLKMTNYFDVSNKSVLHIKGLNIIDALFGTQNYNRVIFYDENKEIINVCQLTSYTDKDFYSTADYDSDVTILNLNTLYDYFLSVSLGENTKYIRLGGIRTVTDDSDIVITADENIAEAEHGYDYVNINADFTAAKGELVGYFSGHTHADYIHKKSDWGINIITHRCDAKEENGGSDDRIVDTITEQSFDVVTVNTATKTIYLTKIGAGSDRSESY